MPVPSQELPGGEPAGQWGPTGRRGTGTILPRPQPGPVRGYLEHAGPKGEAPGPARPRMQAYACTPAPAVYPTRLCARYLRTAHGTPCTAPGRGLQVLRPGGGTDRPESQAVCPLPGGSVGPRGGGPAAHAVPRSSRPAWMSCCCPQRPTTRRTCMWSASRRAAPTGGCWRAWGGCSVDDPGSPSSHRAGSAWGVVLSPAPVRGRRPCLGLPLLCPQAGVGDAPAGDAGPTLRAAVLGGPRRAVHVPVHPQGPHLVLLRWAPAPRI